MDSFKKESFTLCESIGGRSRLPNAAAVTLLKSGLRSTSHDLESVTEGPLPQFDCSGSNVMRIEICSFSRSPTRGSGNGRKGDDPLNASSIILR